MPLLALFLLTAVLFLGCGADRAAVPQNADTGGLSFRVAWPEVEARLVPSAAQSVKLVVLDKNTSAEIINVVLTRTSPTAKKEGLRSGTPWRATATAYPNPDASGTAQASGSVEGTVPAAKVDPITLTMNSAIAGVAVTPTPTMVRKGGTAQLTATAKDAQGNVVLVSGTWQWASSDPSVASVVAASPDQVGTVTAGNGGPVTITVTEKESQKSATATVTTVRAAVAQHPWPKLGCDLPNTGRSPFVGAAQPTKRWEFYGWGLGYMSPAIAADGTIYAASQYSMLYAVNPDGTKKWEFAVPGGGGMLSSPAIAADGTVYFGHQDGKLRAVNPDGTAKWEFATGNTINAGPAVGADGTVYVASCDHMLYALNPSGTVRWVFTAGGELGFGGSQSVAFGTDGTIYVQAKDQKLYAVNSDGTKKWELAVGYVWQGGPVVAADGTIYVDTGNLVAVNPNGTIKWQYSPTGDNCASGLALGPDGTVYVGARDFKLYAVNPDKTTKWSFPMGAAPVATPVVDADGTIYSGCYDDILYAISPDGTEKWRFLTKANVIVGPAIDSDGTVYLISGGGDKRLYALGPW